jgi:hypothetical protein
MQFPNSRNYKLPRRVLTDPLELVRGSSPGAVTERGWGGCATKHRATMWNHTAHLCNPHYLQTRQEAEQALSWTAETPDSQVLAASLLGCLQTPRGQSTFQEQPPILSGCDKWNFTLQWKQSPGHCVSESRDEANQLNSIHSLNYSRAEKRNCHIGVTNAKSPESVSCSQ